jgi:hypothetical protein
MTQTFDLLGDPVPEGWGRRGRPPHVVTDDNRRKVLLLLAFDYTDAMLARALRITRPTLRKHYFRELRARDEALPALEASTLAALFKGVQDGNASAIRMMLERLDRRRLELAGATFGTGVGADAEDDEDEDGKLGKKRRAALDARTAHEGTSWGDLLPTKPAARH